MAENSTQAYMPEDQERALIRAYADFASAMDPSDSWANRRLASVVNAATSAGWSRRTTASELGISRERALKISQYKPSLSCDIPRYRPGAPFPASAAGTFRRIEQEIRDRREEARREVTALIRAAHSAGWPYQVLGGLVGATGEWIRQLHDSDTDTAGIPAPAFHAYRRPLKGRTAPRPRGTLGEEQRRTMKALAAKARGAAKIPPLDPVAELPADRKARLERTLEARNASEQLSAMIIKAKADRVRWEELDEACGYKPGGARARAVRHGYGKLPPTMTGYAAARRQRETPDENPENV
ncbi:hypothetical protein [Arthrobacter sp. zg-Y1110]|uniref:hypothetical protein n=1 Tax=Arthrobacter sp. zg-Y1110 TaxID=2886932 RepID=UPI001D1500E9|nr:hypothetical protein [Arthrobacter sp. zg-Y1110]MCC3292563.1 hypothetical protein [Arthrobacter sp. zg-Y1110]UWX87005.1 hypothetical protein N2K99_16780 [Arthrobacter sp. zg-Y1110]